MATSLLSPAINGSYSVRIMAGSSLSTMASLTAVPVGARCLHGLASPSLSEASSRSFLLKSSFNGESLASRGPALPRKRIPVRYAGSPVCLAAAADAEGSDLPAVSSSVKKESLSFAEKNPALVTGFFFFTWYFLNVIFNILNKKIYNYFPYPYFVSVIHLLVGVAYCLVSWALVAVSFTHTIKALEPFFNAAASQFILGQHIPIPLWLSLAPVVLGVSMASLTELSFNWTGFLSAMTSNIAFTYRNIYSKKAMTGMDSTNVYAYISIISLLFCIPPAILIEGPKLLQYGFADAISKVGLNKFVSDLFWVGMFYHLYNQIANNTLERVAPLTHAVGNVLKRVFVIGFSIIVFGNKISTQTGIGTAIAIVGVAIYSFIKAGIEESKKKPASAGKLPAKE
ncbi:hypothetical protein O6H91_10G090300 [Diphasiastrum complanatum]|uniref:Uncharacterized protein n=1 Tax=Diphasiastrum complanatum TaxID=34168 RepID=A0ACC2CJF4_DIPCM|nr:hypothetical protein O6H91_10G090300 [Diphasiastrum complanatum]